MLNVFQFERDIAEISHVVQSKSDESWIAVCPSPQKSDMFRDIINDLGLGRQVEVITISKFVNDILALGDDVNRVKKSALMVDLWTLWKIKINNDYDKFRFCFDLFTEIRSYSLDQTILESLKELVEPQNLEGISLFNAYFQSQDIVDEQRSYQLVGENFSKSNLGKSYIIWGFDHLNSNQIDMIKQMADSTDVFVPVAKSVLSACDNLDWPMWLTTEKSEDFQLDKISVNSFEVPKGRLSEYLNKIVEDNKKFNLVHVDKSLDLYKINSLYFGVQNFKTNYDLFDKALEDVMENLLELFKEGKRLESSLFTTRLEEVTQAAFKKNDLLLFKVCLSFKELLLEYIDRSELNEFLEVADLKCLKEVLTLDLPRSSVVSLSMEEEKSILERDFLLKNFDEEGRTFLFVERGSAGALQDSNKYPNEIMSVFSAYGPLQTKKYEVLNLAHQIESFFLGGGELIFESGAFDSSVEWEEILKNIDRRNIIVEKEDKKIKELTSLKNEKSVGVISATKVQSYIDCPRKYFYDYVERVDIRARSSDIIGSDMKGVIEHEVVETYIKEQANWSNEAHREVVDRIFDKFIDDSRVDPSLVSVISAKAEIIAYTTNTIKRLIEVQNKLGAKCEFEVDIANFAKNTSGRIDLVITYNDKIYVFDFKRSGFGVPSKKEFEGYDKIQLWYYLKILQELGKEVGGFGYINFSEFNKSLVYSTNSESILYDILCPDVKVSNFKEPYEDILKYFDESFCSTIERMEEDNDFFPTPKNAMVCNFCVASSICPKSTNGGAQ